MSSKSKWTCQWCGEVKLHTTTCDCASTPKQKKSHYYTDKRCQASRKTNAKLKTIKTPINSGWGQKQCTANTYGNTKYCRLHQHKIGAGYNGTQYCGNPNLVKQKKLYEKYFQECLKLIVFDMPEMTIGDIYSYIEYQIQSVEGRACSNTSIKNWYRRWKVRAGFPQILSGGASRAPYKALLTGVNDMPHFCPDCNKPPKSQDGHWTPIGLKKHLKTCKGLGSYIPPSGEKARRTSNRVMRMRHAEVMKNWLRGVPFKENCKLTGYSSTQLKRIIKKLKDMDEHP